MFMKNLWAFPFPSSSSEIVAILLGTISEGTMFWENLSKNAAGRTFHRNPEKIDFEMTREKALIFCADFRIFMQV